VTIAARKQLLTPGRRVEMFDLDLDTFQTGLKYYFCSIGNTGSATARHLLVQTTQVGSVSQNAKQLLTISPATSTGTFTLQYGATVSSPLPYNATYSEIQTALNTVVGSGKTLCTGTGVNSGGVTVEFIGVLALTEIADLVAVSSCTSPDTNPIQWRGNSYTPIPVMAEGFESSGQGSLPTPTLKFANVGLLGSAIINEFGDPVGAKITRWVTYSDYLDDGATPDPNEHFLPEIWFVERKKAQNRVFIEFELSAAMDQAGRLLPGRQVLRDACNLRYRSYLGLSESTGKPTFRYNETDMGCPWTGTNTDTNNPEGPYIDHTGTVVANPALDVCGKKLSDCKARFNLTTKILPFGGFPGVNRIKVE
jgi:lambda family phage minor tail protein L